MRTCHFFIKWGLIALNKKNFWQGRFYIYVQNTTAIITLKDYMNPSRYFAEVKTLCSSSYLLYVPLQNPPKLREKCSSMEDRADHLLRREICTRFRLCKFQCRVLPYADFFKAKPLEVARLPACYFLNLIFVKAHEKWDIIMSEQQFQAPR